jgi:branched-chain amino acid transport system ATP-binding protein
MELEVRSLSKSFGSKPIFAEIDLSISNKGVYAIVGTNGAGKTTLFNVICKYSEPTNGQVFVKGVSTSELSPHQVAHLGLCRSFQDLRFSANQTVYENIWLAVDNLYRSNHSFLTKRNYEKSKAKEIAYEVGLINSLDVLAADLSYGQQKLLTLACCIATNGSILLLDEPVAGVSQPMKEHIIGLLKSLASNGKTIIVIEHDSEFLNDCCDTCFFLSDGQLSEFSSYEELRKSEQVKEAYV